MKKKIQNKYISNDNILLYLLVILTFIMTVGYANYGETLKFNGGISVLPDGKFEITKVSLVNSSNLLNSELPVITKNGIEFNLNYSGKEKEFYVTYDIELSNNSSYEYVYNGYNAVPTIISPPNDISTVNTQLTGINYGEIIPPKTKKNVNLKIILLPSDVNKPYNVNLKFNLSVNNSKTGQILINCNPNSLDLRNNNKKAPLNIELINSYKFPVNIKLTSSNTNFELVDSNGILIEQLPINANSNKNITVYLTKKENTKFYENQVSTKLIVSAENINTVYSNDILILVDKEIVPDSRIPQIGPIKWEIKPNKGVAKVSWTRLDTAGTNIKNFTILLYNSTTNTKVKTFKTKGEIYSYTMKNISPGSYYVKIYGEDKLGNSGVSYVETADENSVYCRKSSIMDLKWVFNVTTHLTNLTYKGANTVKRGANLSASIAPKNSTFSLPNSISVKMNGIELQTTEYTYNSTSGEIIINKVSGDIDITASAINSCLIEGTKILLANGKTKNIELIDYDDLLKTWSYDLGKFVYTYPIWIEKGASTYEYQKNTFSDGNILNTVGFHGIFNVDLNRFVSVDDPNNFNIGTNIYKFKNNRLMKTSVVNIETIKKKVNYYHIVTTRYQNIISNNILTTDGTTILSNVYGFTKNLTWPKDRLDKINNKKNLYSYDEFRNLMPYYMFKGMRMKESRILSNLGYINEHDFKTYLLQNQLNNEMMKLPEKNKNNKRLWMVTTSDDIINETNKKLYKLEEGSYYKIKNPKNRNNFLYWYNSSDNKTYIPGDIIQIWHGIHLEAIYKR